MLRSTWVCGGIALAALLVGGCGQRGGYVPPPPPKVSVARPVTRAVTDQAEFTGTMRGLETLEVRARVEGNLENIHFADGARVNVGDLLFTIEPARYQRFVEGSRAALRLREAELELAEVTLRRKKAALKDRAVSEIDVLAARADRDGAAAAVEVARAALKTAELDLSYSEVRAAIGGTIGRRLVDVGNLVGAGENTLLATIVRDDELYVYFHVSERDLLRFRKYLDPKVAAGEGSGETPVYLSLSEGSDDLPVGRLDYMDNRVDAGTGTIEVRAVFPNPDRRLLAGLFTRVRVPLGEPRKALLVPEPALGADQQGRFVLVVGDDGIVQYRPVRIGQQAGELRVIEDGLGLDDRVIVAGMVKARPGSPVEPVDVEVEEPAR